MDVVQQDSSWLQTIFRGMFGFLDKIIYGGIELFYGTFVEITNLSILSQDSISAFATRIYVFLGFIMLFKIAFSLIQMFLNPDNLTGDKGAGKLIQKIIVMLILLVSVPTIFNAAYRIQAIILENNILGNLIMGATSYSSDDASTLSSNMGSTISGSIMSGFFYEFGQQGSSVVFECINTSSEDCFSEINWSSTTNGKYDYYYNYLISTIAGGLALWVIIMFTFDVAVRSVKLIFLQLIAPIPIISSIDPKGQKTFDNWVQNCIKTYLDVFVRLMIIFFVVFLIGEITAGDGLFTFYDATTGEVNNSVGFFTSAWVIVGLLLFAKEAPKLMGDMLGIKLDGKFTMNPFKKAGEIPLVGKGASFVAGGVDSKIHGGSFLEGGRMSSRDFSWTGSDGKKSILSTADREAKIGAQKKDLEESYQARRNIHDANGRFDKGKKSMGKKEDLVTEADYKKAGFKNDDFIESAMRVDESKNKQTIASQNLQTARTNLQRKIQTDPDATEADLKIFNEAIVTAEEALDKQRKILEVAETTHKDLSKIHKKDAELEMARKVAKGARPTEK